MPRHIGELPVWKRYIKGMKDLGRGLIVLGIFQIVVGVISLKNEPPFSIFIFGMGVLHLSMGVFAYRQHGRINYLEIIWSILLFVLNSINLASNLDENRKGASLGLVFGFILAVALFYYAVKNITALSFAAAFSKALSSNQEEKN